MKTRTKEVITQLNEKYEAVYLHINCNCFSYIM
jgi:hypothetical protein